MVSYSGGFPCAQPCQVMYEERIYIAHSYRKGVNVTTWPCMQGYAWAEDKEHCEEYGRMLSADPTKVSQRAKKRGLPQVACRLRSLCRLPSFPM